MEQDIKDQALETRIDASTQMVITTPSEPAMPQELYKATMRMLQQVDLGWADLLPALQYAYNTSYSPKVDAIPFHRLFGFEPNHVKTTQPLLGDDLPSQRLNMYL